MYDEVLFTDPAVNLYFGEGFISTFWHQNSNKFFAENSQLYSYILYLWMKLFGFSLLSVRSLNCFLIAFSTFILWISVIKMNLINSKWARLGLVLFLTSSYNAVFSACNGRYDALQIMLLALFILAFSLSSRIPRFILIIIISILIPFAGINLLPYITVLCFIILIYFGFKFLKEITFIIIGIAIGALSFLAILHINSVLNDFFNGFNYLRTLRGTVIVLKDPSYYFMLIMGLAIIVYEIMHRTFKFKSAIFFGCLIAMIIPIVYNITGHYPNYYSWMACIPLSVCFWSHISKYNYLYTGRYPIICGLICVCLWGIPLFSFLTIFEWDSRNYKYVEAFCKKNISKVDWVYCNSQAYYATKKITHEVYGEEYPFTEEEKNKISVLIIKPEMSNIYIDKFSGIWRATDYIKPKKSSIIEWTKSISPKYSDLYNLCIYKKDVIK